MSKNKSTQNASGRDSKKNLKVEEPITQEPREPSSKELLLQKEFEDLERKLQESRKRVEELRKENVWLQEESTRVRTENQEYMSYMNKKTAKRQTAVISLNDYHRHQVMELQRQKEDLEQDFQARKRALQATLLEKENELARLSRELDGLNEYRLLHEEQKGQIKELEAEIAELRNTHSQSIRDLKSRYVEEKREFEKTSQAKIDDEAKKANRAPRKGPVDNEAVQCLNEHMSRVSEENRRLRHDLLTLINQSQALNDHKRRLLAQRQHLLLECQYAEDLRAIRGRGSNNKIDNASGNASRNSNSKLDNISLNSLSQNSNKLDNISVHSRNALSQNSNKLGNSSINSRTASRCSSSHSHYSKEASSVGTKEMQNDQRNNTNKSLISLRLRSASRTADKSSNSLAEQEDKQQVSVIH